MFCKIIQIYHASDAIDPNVNMVLFQLFKAYLERNVRPYVATVSNLDGIGVLVKLQKVFAPTTYSDFSRALQDLQDLQMHPGESIASFMRRFHTLQEAMNDVAQGPNLVPNEFAITQMFLGQAQCRCHQC